MYQSIILFFNLFTSFIKKATPLTSLVFLSFFSLTTDTLAVDIDNPFILPQLNFAFTQVDKTIHLLKHPDFKPHLNGAWSQMQIGVLELNIQVNATPWMNIGGGFNFVNLSLSEKDLARFDVKSRNFMKELGLNFIAYTQFFYVPSFLKTQWTITNVFSRVDIGLGPEVLYFNGPTLSGVSISGGLQIGSETYFKKWFGIGIALGQSASYGESTLHLPEEKSMAFWTQSRNIILYLKSTYF